MTEPKVTDTGYSRRAISEMKEQLDRIEATLAELKPLIDLAKGFLDSPAGRLQKALLGRKHG